MKGFCLNRNVFYCVYVVLTWRIGFMAIDAIFLVRLLIEGFPKEILVLIILIVLPVTIVIAKYLGDIT